MVAREATFLLAEKALVVSEESFVNIKYVVVMLFNEIGDDNIEKIAF